MTGPVERTYGAMVNPALLAVIPAEAVRLLDIGCGAGGTSLAWRSARAGRQVIGIELDPANAEAARGSFDHVVIGNAEDGEILEAVAALGPFDCITFGDVLEHLYDPWDTLRRYARLLAPQGTICACIPNIQHWSILHNLLAGEWRYADRGILDRTHLRFFTRATIEQLFTQADLVITEIQDLVYDSTASQDFVERLKPGLAALGFDAEQVRAKLAPLQYVVTARHPVPSVPVRAEEQAITEAQKAIDGGQPQVALAVVAPLLAESRDARIHHLAAIAKALGGDTLGAIGHFRDAEALDSTLNEAVYGLAVVLLNRGDMAEAVECLRRSVALDPKFQRNRYFLAIAHFKTGNYLESYCLFEALARESPEDAQIVLVRDHVRQALGDARAAAADLIHAGHAELAVGLLAGAVLTRQDFDLLWKTAAALMEKAEYHLAKEMFSRMVELDPQAWSAGWNAHYCRLQIGEVDGALDWLRRLDHPENPGRAMILDAMLYVAPLTTTETMRSLHALATYAQPLLGAGANPLAHGAGEAAKRPLRIGFLSRIFHLPNYAQIYLGLFRNLDRGRFRVVALCNGSVPEEGSAVRACVDELVELHEADPRTAAQSIHQAGIDVLVDCNGFGAIEGNRILDFKPAPIQAAWSNKHYTSGLATMDWMIADASIDGIDPANFVERIYRLPCFHIDMPEIADVLPVPAPVGTNGYVTLGAQVAGLKLNRAMLATWARILHASPGTRLLLRFGSVADSHLMIRAIMAAEGIGEERLDLRFATGHGDYLETFAEIDLVLDRFPISGGVTSLESLLRGVPIVSWVGESWASRRGGALLRQLGLPELVADSRGDYIMLAAELCRDHGRLVRYREGLRAQVSAAIRGSDRMLAGAMGDAFDHFWHEHTTRN